MRDDLKISDRVLNIYSSINYYNRYKELSNKFRGYNEDDALEKTDKKIILNLFNELGYTAKYESEEKFYQIIEESKNHSFYFHISLKYGLTELIFGLNKGIDKTGKSIEEIVGGTIVRTCKLIELNIGKETEGYIKTPIFRDYKELKEILKEAFSLYEDLKKEILKL